MAEVYNYVTGLKKDMLEDYWEELLKHADFYEAEEIKFFSHCTSINKKESILKSGRFEGGYTGLPKNAPLASNPDLVGIWLAPSTVDIPQKSPYGTHQMCMKAKDLISYMFQPYVEEVEVDSVSDDRWDAADDSDEETCSGGKGRKGKGSKKGKEQKSKKKQRKPKKNQKDCYATGHKSVPPLNPRGEKPSVFFECAHYYGSTQYVRMLLVRAGHPQMNWCIDNLVDVNIHDNPFFQLKWGRLYSYTVQEDGKKGLVVELLVVGDIVLDKLNEKPSWDTVGKLQRAGFDPRVGVLR